MANIHPQARTTPLIRAEIQASQDASSTLAARYNISRQTVRKWKQREDAQDGSHRPHKLCTTLSPLEEMVVVEIRRTLLLPLDDLLVITRGFINPQVSRSGLDRCLRRHGVSRLADLYPETEGETPPKKTFKDYEPGFVHIDIKYLPKMPDEDQHRYLFVAIDRATRWVFLRVYDDQSQASSVDFLQRLHAASPMRIVKILTDNGSQFTDRFTCKAKEPSGQHAFDQACQSLAIEHRLIPPRHPQTNGMVERFNGRISELVQQTRFRSSYELETTLMRYTEAYNHHLPQRALNHQTPMQTMKMWQDKCPGLFVSEVNDQAGLDTYAKPLQRRSKASPC